MIDTAYLDATALADLVRKKEVTPLELVEETIERIERLNPTLNAVVIDMYEEARKVAAGPLVEGPFTGVPFLLKDFLAEYAGVRFTESTAFLKDYISTQDTELVRRFKASGVIFVAKTNLPEVAIGPTTEPRLHGPTHNPWDTTRTPGGSSGGAGASVAAGIVPMAHGNDAGGSIRGPASCCGVFGLKPTRGRNPLGPDYGDLWSGLVAEHVLTRSVRDCAAMLDVTGGPDAGDPFLMPPVERPFVEEVGADPGRLRIAFSSRTPLGEEVHPDCVAAVEDAANLCVELGHEVVEAEPEFDGEVLWQSFTRVLAAGVAAGIDGLAERTGRTPTEEDFEPFVWMLAARGREPSAADHLTSVQKMQYESRKVGRFFTDYDLWLTPTLGLPPVPLGTFAYTEGEDPFTLRRKMAEFAPFMFVTNATGQPAASVPLYWNDEGLPIGVQFAGRFGDEATIFRLSSQLEEARPWAGRRPPVSV